MRTGVLFLALVVGVQSVAVAQVQEVPVQFSSLNAGSASKGFFQGRVAVHPDSVVIAFDSVYIELLSEGPPQSVYHLDSMTVGLVSPAADGGWRIYAEGPTWVIPEPLAERSAFSLRDLRSAIVRPAGALLRESWIVVTFYQIVAPRFVPREQQSPGTTYAHSSRGLFGFVDPNSKGADISVGAPGGAVSPDQEVSVEFSTLNSTWASQGFFQGRVAVDPDSVVIAFDSVYIQLQSGEILDSMRVGLASFLSGDQWRIHSEGPTWVIPDSLSERSGFPLSDLRAAIARPTGQMLAESWLVVSFYSMLAPELAAELLPPGVRPAPGISYAHSRRNLFARIGR